MLIDTHCHLNFSAYKDDLDEVIDRTLKKDVWIINVGSQSTTSKRSVEIAEKYKEGIYAAVGLHPTHLYETYVDLEEVGPNFKSRTEDWDADFYRKLAKSKKVRAIGEMGLDYHFIPENVDKGEAQEKQKQVFRFGLDLADELDLPIIIHSRDVHGEVCEILKKYLDAGRLKKRGVAHCFTGSWEEAQKYLELGFLISFTGIITFKPREKQKHQQEKILEVVHEIPLEKCMIETDAPYLSPEPYRGKRNEPLYVEEIAKKIAEIKGLDFEEIARATTETAREFFGI